MVGFSFKYSYEEQRVGLDPYESLPTSDIL